MQLQHNSKLKKHLTRALSLMLAFALALSTSPTTHATGGDGGSGGRRFNKSSASNDPASNIPLAGNNCEHYWGDLLLDSYDTTISGKCYITTKTTVQFCQFCQSRRGEPRTDTYDHHHDITIHDAKYPTCIESGYGTITSCDCGELYWDRTNEITPAIGHSYGEMYRRDFRRFKLCKICFRMLYLWRY